MANSITFTSAPFTQVTQFLPADTTALKTILTADATYARRVYGITAFTDNSAVSDVSIHITDGTTTWKATTISLPINSGATNAIVPVDLFASTQLSPFIKQRDASGAPYLNIPAGYSLKLNYTVALAATKVANFTVIGETYA